MFIIIIIIISIISIISISISIIIVIIIWCRAGVLLYVWRVEVTYWSATTVRGWMSWHTGPLIHWLQSHPLGIKV
jgi:hypothetical protein